MTEAIHHANFAENTLTSGITSGATTMVLDALTRFPATEYFWLVLWNSTDYTLPGDDPDAEVVLVTNVNAGTKTLTIDRGQQDTTAKDHNTALKTYKARLAPTAWAVAKPFIRIEDLGAVGDGTTDCYDAMQRAAAELKAAGGGTLWFKGGTYLIDQVVTAGSGKTDIEFEDCDGLKIIGNGSTIECKGDWTRTATSESTVDPFMLIRCNRVEVSGFTLDGNVDQMIRQSEAVNEGSGLGLALRGCTQVVIKDVYAHHFHTDGFYIDRELDDTPQKICRDVTFISCHSKNNARGGLGLINCRNFTAIACTFEGSGQNLGTYTPYHPPGFGVDIEPNIAPPTTDINTANLSFINCRFVDNVRAFMASVTANTSNVKLINCEIEQGVGDHQYQVIMSVVNGWILGGNITLGDGEIRLSWGASETSPGTQMNGMQAVRVKGSKKVLVADTSGGTQGVFVRDCFFESTATAALTGLQFIMYRNSTPDTVTMPLEFTGNYVFMPAAAHDGVTLHSACHFQGAKLVADNRYETDLATAGLYFYNVYTDVQNARNERFLSGVYYTPATGMTAMDEETPFGTGIGSVGQKIMFWDPSSNDRHPTISYANAAPSTGTWLRGDVVFNSLAAAAGKVGWVCTSGGSPGTWKAFGVIDT